MEFRRELVSQGVSEAGAEQALLGQPVTGLQDQQAIKRLGYYVSLDGQVSLARSLGPKCELPKHWLDRERAPERGGDQVTLQITKAALLENALLKQSAGPTLIGHKVLSLSSSAGAAAMAALLDKTRKDTKPSADNTVADLKKKILALEKQIAELELQIAALQKQMEQAARDLEAELAKEFLIMHLANPLTFPLFVVVYGDWKKRVNALQKKLIGLINQGPELFNKLVELKNQLTQLKSKLQSLGG
jgi:chaperonin cofactor prefoldin